MTLIFPLVLLVASCRDSNSVENPEVKFQPVPQAVARNETLQYEISNDADEVIGRGVLSTTISTDGLLILLEKYYRATDAEPTDTIETQLLSMDLTPVRGLRVVRGDSERNIESLDYHWSIEASEDKRGQLRNYFVRTDELDQNQDERIPLAREENIYANSSGLWLWRALPFEIGLKTSYMTVDSLNVKQQRHVVTVPQEESLIIGSKTYDVWRVLIRSGRATRSAWVEKVAPNRVLRWDNGVTIMTILE